MSFPVRRYRSFRAFLIVCALVLIGIPLASLVASLLPLILATSFVTLYLTLGTLLMGAATRRATAFYAFLYVATWVAGIGFAIAVGQFVSFLACAWLFAPIGITILIGTNTRGILTFLRGQHLFQPDRRSTYYQAPQQATPQRAYAEGYQAKQSERTAYKEEERNYSYPYPSTSSSDQQEQPQTHYPTM
ncbi:hypothetical protein [Ktedonospora formicarum]|uniref:Uncharacterized protein n=1 Tax=Ktedonospora formicarum TaxID=2778364 RepID=A0A8J3I453_9CHLR|nr:hypothetical protein [Ktedonospora formicarum]GHO45079.1 hypothetical protein KSX_32420 [Ktedonospora formicarum]